MERGKPGTVHSIRISESNRHSSLRMSRIARAVIEGMPHHITQRGNGHSRLFDTDSDRTVYPNSRGWSTRFTHYPRIAHFSEIGDSTPLNTNFMMRLLAESAFVIRLVCKAQRYVTGNGKNLSDEMLPRNFIHSFNNLREMQIRFDIRLAKS